MPAARCARDGESESGSERVPDRVSGMTDLPCMTAACEVHDALGELVGGTARSGSSSDRTVLGELMGADSMTSGWW
jgi:hypothetical protein